MKKILSYVLILSLAMTMVISVLPSQTLASLPLSESVMLESVGGQTIWACVGMGAAGVVGIVAASTGNFVVAWGAYGIAMSFFGSCGG